MKKSSVLNFRLSSEMLERYREACGFMKTGVSEQTRMLVEEWTLGYEMGRKFKDVFKRLTSD